MLPVPAYLTITTPPCPDVSLTKSLPPAPPLPYTPLKFPPPYVPAPPPAYANPSNQYAAGPVFPNGLLIVPCIAGPPAPPPPPPHLCAPVKREGPAPLNPCPAVPVPPEP